MIFAGSARRRWPVWAAGVVIAALAGGAAPARAADAPITFAEPSATFRDGRVRVVLLNTTGAEVVAHITVALETDQDAPVPVAVTPTVPAGGLPVPAAGERAVVLTVSGAAGASTATGRLTVRSGRGAATTVTRLPLALDARPAPRVSSWTADVTVTPFWPGDRSAGDLPLTGTQCGAAPSAVLAAGTRTMTVTGSCTTSAGAAVTALAIRGDRDPGEYAGTLTVAGHDVAVRVRQSWPLWLAVLLLLLGFAVAIWQYGWYESWRPAAAARLRLNLMKSRADEQQTAFEEKAPKPFPWRAYDLRPAVVADVERLDPLVPGAMRLWWSDRAVRDLAAVVEQIDQLEAVVAGWPDAAAAFAKAQTSLDDAGGLTGLPLLQGRYEDILGGVVIVADTAALGAVVREIELVPTVLELSGARREAEQRLAALEAQSLSDADRALFGQTRQTGRALASALARLETARDIGPEIQALVTELRAGMDRLPSSSVADENAQEAGPNNLAPTDPGLAGRLLAAVSARLTALRSTVAAHSRAGLDTAVLVLTLVAGLWSGLEALYIGKSWGGPWAAVAAVAWGYGATSVITPLLSAAARLGQPDDEASRGGRHVPA